MGKLVKKSELDRAHVEHLYKAFLADKAENTASSYRIDFEAFAEFLGVDSVGSALRQLMEQNAHAGNALVLAYRTHLRKSAPRTGGRKRYSPATINRRLSALRAILKLGRIMGLATWQIEIEGERPEDVRDTRGPGEEGYAAIVAALERRIADSSAERGESVAVRNLAIVRLLHDAGLRRAEPLSADYPEDLDLPGGRLRVKRKKRREKSWAPISEACVRDIEAWMQCRGTKRGPLFTSFQNGTSGQRLTAKSLNKLFDAIGEEIGIKINPHGLRHTAATTVLDRSNGNLRVAAKFLAHSNLSTVQKYDDDRRDEARQAVELLAPSKTKDPWKKSKAKRSKRSSR